MTALSVRDLTVGFGEQTVLDGVALDVEQSELVVVMGPSGCGKSTLLRAIAGLELIVAGSIVLNGRDATMLPPNQRNIGFVFQDLALFPHLNVGENIAYGLRRRGMRAPARRERVAELLDLVGLGNATLRNVQTLSGGEQQRVAVARALAPSPSLLLLDEPLSALDADRKLGIADEIVRVIGTTGTAALYVTHDPDEAAQVGSRVVRLEGGRLEKTVR